MPNQVVNNDTNNKKEPAKNTLMSKYVNTKPVTSFFRKLSLTKIPRLMTCWSKSIKRSMP